MFNNPTVLYGIAGLCAVMVVAVIVYVIKRSRSTKPPTSSTFGFSGH
jgi:hypothetical protein